LQRGIRAAGFDKPRPIQAKTIPAVLEGRDVLGLAQTGTGKTAAFALPILEHLGSNSSRAPRALILAPTRELAAQIQAETEVLAQYTPLRCVSVFGGVSASSQIRALRRGVDIVIACPGRLLDLHQQGELDLRRIEVLVLDEADHMFDMGFLPSIKRILAALPQQRQNLLFSATMPREIRGLADRVLHRPHVVELAHSKPVDSVVHARFSVDQKRKEELLRHLLDEEEFSSGIVFLRTKHRAKRLAQKLTRDGHDAVALQGNMSQGQRERAMLGFREGRFKVLVATDIAARGIDVAGVSHVINFDVPNTPDAYTHRIGRTGRAGLNGKAYTFVCHDEADALRAIEKRIGEAIPVIHAAGFSSNGANNSGEDYSNQQRRGGRGGGRGRSPFGRSRIRSHGGGVPTGRNEDNERRGGQRRGRSRANANKLGGGKLGGSNGARRSQSRTNADVNGSAPARPQDPKQEFGAGVDQPRRGGRSSRRAG